MEPFLPCSLNTKQNGQRKTETKDEPKRAAVGECGLRECKANLRTSAFAFFTFFISYGKNQSWKGKERKLSHSLCSRDSLTDF